MSQNLFKINLDEEHVDEVNAIETNISWAKKLMEDLAEAFDVRVEAKRPSDRSANVNALVPTKSRYWETGWMPILRTSIDKDGVECFLHFEEKADKYLVGVTFKELCKEIGGEEYPPENIRLQALGALYDYVLDNHPGVWKFDCTNGYSDFKPTVGLLLSEGTPRFNDRIKLVIAYLRSRDVKLRGNY